MCGRCVDNSMFVLNRLGSVVRVVRRAIGPARNLARAHRSGTQKAAARRHRAAPKPATRASCPSFASATILVQKSDLFVPLRSNNTWNSITTMGLTLTNAFMMCGQRPQAYGSHLAPPLAATAWLASSSASRCLRAASAALSRRSRMAKSRIPTCSRFISLASLAPVWKSTSELGYQGCSSYRDNVASMMGRLKFDFHTGLR